MPDLDRIAGRILRRGSSTAREAAFEALAEARRWSADAEIVRISCGSDGGMSETTDPLVGPDGRIRPSGHWAFLFSSVQQSKEGFVVFVPLLGPVRSSITRASGRNDRPIGQNWIDTDHLMTLASEIAKLSQPNSAGPVECVRCELRTGRSVTGVDTRGKAIPSDAPQPPPSDLWWEASCISDGPKKRREFVVRLDAVSGGHIYIVEVPH
jgi:hypothetical protein